MLAPNDIWTADFKGHFKTRDGLYCYPLTVVDGFSRYLLACQGLRSTEPLGTQPVFRRLFQEYGLPRIILTDNEEVDNEIWNVYFGPLRLGVFHEPELVIHEGLSRTDRRKLSPMSPD
jgi:integrase-like protein